MTTLRIARIEIQGFRAFGKNAQTLDFNSMISCVWGPNSQGKTSLAEAFEFLFTGEIVRREILASAQDEFAEALRNVHMPKDMPVYVQATLLAGENAHVVRRTMESDYSKKQGCRSTLEIDGVPATEADLQSLGVVLSQPPLRAPVLAQHTLGYLFSARPADRANYFKALLEVNDLEAMRAIIANLDTTLGAADPPILAKLDRAAAVKGAAGLKAISAKAPTAASITASLTVAVSSILQAEGVEPVGTLDAQLAQLSDELTARHGRTFPIRGFDRAPFTDPQREHGDQIRVLSTYLEERDRLNKELRDLIALFAEALRIPAIAHVHDTADCPLCGTPDSLTAERVAFMRNRLEASDVFRAAEQAAVEAVAILAIQTEDSVKKVASAVPHVFRFSSKVRRERGFRVERVRALLGPAASLEITAWLTAARDLWRHWRVVARTGAITGSVLQTAKANIENLVAVESIEDNLDALARAVRAFAESLQQYSVAERPVVDALKTVLDTQSQTTGWQDLIDLAQAQLDLRTALAERVARDQLKRELAQAVRQIDIAKEKVLDEKFQALSSEVETWWSLLRPDELSFFAAVKPRPGAKRTIDFKAGLCATDERKDVALRDVIAVFSQSQLHCLGLALFLARAVHEGTGFIVLDDPILSSDEDHRAHFQADVLERLMAAGIQVIVLTQEHRTCKDITERYTHRKIDTFQINLSNPAEGTSIVNKADDLAALLNRAEILIRGGHPDLHRQGGEVLRNAAERLCKEIIVKNERTTGNHKAAISNYDGQNLGQLSPKVEPLMTRDPSHPGKLRAVGSNLNPANHDDDIPGPGILRVSLGDLKMLKRAYL